MKRWHKAPCGLHEYRERVAKCVVCEKVKIINGKAAKESAGRYKEKQYRRDTGKKNGKAITYKTRLRQQARKKGEKLTEAEWRARIDATVAAESEGDDEA